MTTDSKETIAKFAHDARNPLNAISMNTELALMLANAGDEKLIKALNAILSQCSSLDQLISQFSENQQSS